MKNIFKILGLLATILIISCEEVVDIPLDTENPRLVIEASINWQKGTTGNVQKIKLTTTTDYYTNVIPVVSGAIITVKNSSNVVFNFTENGSTGEYICNNFVPVINENYTLNIAVNGQNYSATESLIPVPTITNIVQYDNLGFTGDQIGVKAFFNDRPNIDDFYLFKYKYSNVLNPNLYVGYDRFFQGNEFFSLSRNQELKAGDGIEITHFGISEQYFNYMRILLNLTGSQGAGPFQSPPATVKGNIVNNTNFDNYPLGFFRLSESDVRNYIVQ